MSQESPTGKDALEWAWKNREWVAKRLADVYAWFRGGKKGETPRPGILLLGPGGVGKTTLGRLLAGNYDLLLDSFGEYDESTATEHYVLKDSPGVEVVVPPGQEHRREASWAELHADIAAGAFRGVILLLSYGYHTLGPILGYKGHSLYQGDKDTFLKAYLEDRQAAEMSVLRQLSPHLKAAPGPLWMLTLVGKQDLWWPRRSEVGKHYQEGAYSAEIESVRNQLGGRNFRHEFVFASLVISNFLDGEGDRLTPNAQGYDHPLQIQSLRRLFEMLDALKGWEAGQ